MLTSTFLHIPYVSEKTEQELWTNNIRTWDDFLGSGQNVQNADLIRKFLHISKERYEKRDHEFFSNKLMFKHQWRAYDDFRDRCCFLDIETTGLSKERDEITVIGLFDGNTSKVFINGKNMDEFPYEVEKYGFIVTFNGALFDIPFIKAKYPELRFSHLHADLRFVMRSLGFTGGLKKIEQIMGIERESDLKGMTGYDAVKLWHQYKRYSDEKALDKLVRYNIEDIENLKTLMDFAYDKLKDRCIGTHCQTSSDI